MKRRFAGLMMVLALLGVGSARAQTLSTLNLTGQTAAITSTSLFAVPAGGAGMYRFTVSEILTTAGTAGTITTSVVCNNGVANVTQTTATITTTASLGTEVDAVFTCFAGASTAINYLTTFTSVTGTPAYSVRIRMEALQ